MATVLAETDSGRVHGTCRRPRVSRGRVLPEVTYGPGACEGLVSPQRQHWVLSNFQMV